MTEREAWQDGFDAFKAGKPRENLNPWNASLYAAWLRGWDTAAEFRENVARYRHLGGAL